jgi:hypothetical protein
MFGWLKSQESVEPAEAVERRITEMLRPHFSDLFVVNYHPKFPRPDGTTFSLFQVVFAVGPGNDAEVRAAVHKHIEQLLRILSPLLEVRQSVVSLRARRHIPPLSRPDHPHMFIECSWHGSRLAATDDGDHGWHSRCLQYVNRFDDDDPLNVVRKAPLET